MKPETAPGSESKSGLVWLVVGIVLLVATIYVFWIAPTQNPAPKIEFQYEKSG